MDETCLTGIPVPTATSDGTELYFELHGTPESPNGALVFAHGAGGNAASWWQQVPAFINSYQVVVFDHRGFGRSVCPPELQNAVHFESDLIAILDAAEIESATVVCQSMGGWTGVRAAVFHPERVRGVFLANTPGAVHNDVVADNWVQLTQRIAEGGGLINRAISESFALDNPERALLYQQIATFNTGAAPNINNDQVRISPIQVVESNVPFHVLASDLDPLFPPNVLAAVADDIGACRSLVEGAGHSTYFEQPSTFNGILGEFLDTLS